VGDAYDCVVRPRVGHSVGAAWIQHANDVTGLHP
jgi:hypothetical protein